MIALLIGSRSGGLELQGVWGDWLWEGCSVGLSNLGCSHCSGGDERSS